MGDRTLSPLLTSNLSMDWRKQFAKPTGALGWMVGHVMAMKNGERSEWVFSLLDLKREDHVLEIGFGSGADLLRASRVAAFVAGGESSGGMVRPASPPCPGPPP